MLFTFNGVNHSSILIGSCVSLLFICCLLLHVIICCARLITWPSPGLQVIHERRVSSETKFIFSISISDDEYLFLSGTCTLLYMLYAVPLSLKYLLKLSLKIMVLSKTIFLWHPCINEIRIVQ